MSRIFICIFILMILCSLNLFGQNVDDMIESLSQTAEETGSGITELSNLLDDIDSYRSQPLDINNASETELLAAPFLSQKQAEAIVQYRLNFGIINTIYELLYTNSFDVNDLERIQPYLFIGKKEEYPKTKLKQLPQLLKHQLILRLSKRGEKAVGYTSTNEEEEPNFQGDPYKAMLRYKINASDWFSAGITTEKDAGEKWLTHKQPDFVSAHLFYKPKKIIHSIAIGDFKVRMGQGLILWNGYSSGKYSFPSSIIRYNQGISGFSGTDETNFLRGVGTSFRLGKFELIIVGSIRKLDANVNAKDSLGNPISVSSIGSSGTHATINQISDKNILEEKLTATHVCYRSTFFEIGATGGTFLYNLPLTTNNELYKQLNFKGNKNSAVGADYRLVWKNVSIAGEYALSDNNKYATFHTLKAEPLAGNSFALAYRNYKPGYKGLHTMAFGENTEANNENGWTVGVEITPLSRIRISAMADLWIRPWLSYRVNTPSEGNEYRLNSAISITKNIDIEIKYRYKKQIQNSVYEPIDYPLPIIQNQLQLVLNTSINTSIKTIIHGYYNQYKTNSNNESGLYIYNDWIILLASKLKLSLRQGFFHTESYYSRIYAYEFSTPWAYSIPYLAGKGTRSAIMLSYTPHSAFTIYLKGSLSYFVNTKSTGSGDNLTNGPRQSEFNILLNWRFSSSKDTNQL